MEVRVYFIHFVILFQFVSLNVLHGQIEIEQDSTVSIGEKFTTSAYLKIQSKNKNTGMYLLNTYAANVSSTRYGVINKLTASTSDEYRGILTDITTDGTVPNKKIGLFNNLNGEATVNSIGSYNWLRNYKTTAYGTFNRIGVTSTPGNISFGTYNFSLSNDNSFKYGMQNYLVGSAPTTYGINNFVNTITTNHSFGIFNTVYQQSTNYIYGTRSNLVSSVSGSKPSYGTFNYIFDKNNQPVYGTYNLIVPEASVTSGSKYGSYNVFTGNGSPTTVYGVYSNINNYMGYAGYFDGPVFTSSGTLVRADNQFSRKSKALENNLQKILLLHPKEYEVSTGNHSKHDLSQLGFVAEDVAKVLPGLVFEIIPPETEERILERPESSALDINGAIHVNDATFRTNIKEKQTPFLAIQYNGFIPVIIGAIQEQQDEIRDLKGIKADVKRYENRILELEHKLTTYELMLEQSANAHAELITLVKSLTNNTGSK